jgi:hypothetical protein
MVRRVLACVFALILAAGAAAPFAQTNVSGDWTLTINGPQGIIDTEATFTQDGEKVTGTMTSPMGEVSVAGTVNGSTVAFEFNVVTPNGPIDVKMTAEVTGADMKGTLDFGMGTADFTGKKK